MNNKITRVQMIEIPVPAQGLGVGARLYIPDQPQLRTQTNQIVVIQRLQSYDVITSPKTPSGAAVVDVAALGSSYLVLNVFGTETIQFIPFVDLINTATTDTDVQRSYNNNGAVLNNITKVDWSKSYIQVGAAVAAGASYLLRVDYVRLPDDNMSVMSTQEMPVIS